MRATRDSFLQFLSDNLSGAIVNPIRRDPNKPDGDVLKTNAVNVKFANADYAVSVASQFVIIDVIHENELSCLDLTTQLWQLLSTRFFTPKFDYSSGTPVATGDVIYWDTVIKFRQVHNPLYYQYHSTINIKHHIH